MTRETRRSIESDLEALEDRETAGKGDPELSISIQRQWVMTRERAESEGRRILGEYDEGPDDADLVIVDEFGTTAEERALLNETFDVEPDT